MSYVVNYYCQNCGSWSPKWLGRCPDCGQYNSFVEEKARKGSGLTGKPDPYSYSWSAEEPIPITKAVAAEVKRLSTFNPELDRVLGGGLVPGSVVLIGGEPGIGKSTLWLQAAASLAKNHPVLLVSGEESVAQIKLRAERLQINTPNLYLFNEINVFNIEKTASQIKPVLLIVDSIQTVFHPELSSAPGGVGQIRESAGHLIRLAKSSAIPLVLIGHITKEGAIAGPRVLEHMVDTVLYFEGEKGSSSSYRIIRSVKNRFGPSLEIGLFEMHDDGLKPVTDPATVFMSKTKNKSAGSAVAVVIEGTRPLLLEVQALVTPTYLSQPRRLFSGVDTNRALITLAVLEKKLKLNLNAMDVYLNVVGGVKVLEPALDLPLALAVLSAYHDKPIPSGWCFFGELGLGGEVRPINQAYVRLKEAERLGLTACLIPNQPVKGKFSLPTLVKVNSLQEAARHIF